MTSNDRYDILGVQEVIEMKRTKLDDRELPDYTHGEEIFNMVSHIVGGAAGQSQAAQQQARKAKGQCLFKLILYCHAYTPFFHFS